jgi:hypothetical protein
MRDAATGKEKHGRVQGPLGAGGGIREVMDMGDADKSRWDGARGNVGERADAAAKGQSGRRAEAGQAALGVRRRQ